MNQLPVRILGIAPYEGMKTLMQKIASNRNDIELTVFVGDLEKGVAIAKEHDLSNFDIIISRGGTAEMLDSSTELPIIEINITVYDILRSIKLVENYSDKYAIIGFPSITNNAHILCDLLQYNIEIITIHSTEEAQLQLLNLRKKGYSMVICDMVTNTLAKSLAMNSILITSGNESIQSAFDQAVKSSRAYQKIKHENKLYKELLLQHNTNTVLYNYNKEIIFSTFPPEHAYALPLIEKELLSTLDSKEKKIIKNIEGNLIFIEGKTFTINNLEYVAFYFSINNIPISNSKQGIKFQNKSDILNDSFNNYISLTNSKSTLTTVESYNKTNSPIIIIGEQGTGKEQLAELIYTQSILQNNPFVTIDFMSTNEKHWNFLTNHYNTPFNNNETTIYLKNIATLSDSKYNQLLSIMSETNLCKRNRILMSFQTDKNTSLPERCMALMNQYSCLTLNIHPLRDRAEELPSLSSIHISQLNLELGKQIIGFENDAMELMQAYKWPDNFTQFKRVLQQLLVITDTPYIKKEETETILNNETRFYMANHSQTEMHFNFDRTLDEINKDIVQQALIESNGNQSQAAKKLGISRTTIWRFLK